MKESEKSELIMLAAQLEKYVLERLLNEKLADIKMQNDLARIVNRLRDLIDDNQLVHIYKRSLPAV